MFASGAGGYSYIILQHAFVFPFSSLQILLQWLGGGNRRSKVREMRAIDEGELNTTRIEGSSDWDRKRLVAWCCGQGGVSVVSLSATASGGDDGDGIRLSVSSSQR